MLINHDGMKSIFGDMFQLLNFTTVKSRRNKTGGGPASAICSLYFHLHLLNKQFNRQSGCYPALHLDAYLRLTEPTHADGGGPV